MTGGWVDPQSLPQGENGRALCRWCQIEVPAGRRRTFCSDYCVREWRLRTDPGFLRDEVFRRDKGICHHCGINTLAEWLRIKKSRGSRRQEALASWGVTLRHRKSLWDADHILPVAEGGGECDLDNLRTLCLRCHRVATRQLRERLKQRGLTASASSPASPRVSEPVSPSQA